VLCRPRHFSMHFLQVIEFDEKQKRCMSCREE
jgi:hypothetical protein